MLDNLVLAASGFVAWIVWCHLVSVRVAQVGIAEHGH